MIRLATMLYLTFASALCAFAQNGQDAPPTAFTEPAGPIAVVVFLAVFFGSIALFGFWIWHRSRKQKDR